MDLFHTDETPQHVCWDRKHYATYEDNLAALKGSKTIYVGNLSFFTTESQIQEIFSAVGPLKRIIMGLNQLTKTPCGFCFVEYFTVQQAQACLKYISGTICDNRQIRCDIDTGFKPGRQFGRGASGGTSCMRCRSSNTLLLLSFSFTKLTSDVDCLFIPSFRFIYFMYQHFFWYHCNDRSNPR